MLLTFFFFLRMGKKQGEWGISGLNLEEMQEDVLSTR